MSALSTVVVLAAEAEAEAGGETTGDGEESFWESAYPVIPHPGELILGIIAFAVLYYFAAKYAVPRLEAMLAQRRSEIQGGIERALERVARAGRQGATDESVQTLSGRLDGVEDKLDRLLAALDGQSQNGNGSANASAQAPADVPADANGSAVEATIEATDAARRKAEELGVDLTQVEGTGADGRITVEDVRKKGDS